MTNYLLIYRCLEKKRKLKRHAIKILQQTSTVQKI